MNVTCRTKSPQLESTSRTCLRLSSSRQKGLGIPSPVRSQAGTVLIIVLWVALGLVSVALYFASSMSFELRASDNRVSGIAADQAIEAGARYVQALLATVATNGEVPDVSMYQCEAVPVGESHFWLIGRAGDYLTQPDEVFFGLVDEGSKLNLNTVTSDALMMLTNMTLELAANMVDWRNTNGTVSEYGDGPNIYMQFDPSYLCKNAPYETIDELRLVYPTDIGLLYGEDLNLNGALDPGEVDTNRNSVADSGLLEYLTVYSREPNTTTNGAQRVNVSRLTSNSTELQSLLQTNLSTQRAGEIMRALGLVSQPGGGRGGGSGGPGGGSGGTTTQTFASPLAFYMRSGMTSDEFATIADSITVASGSAIQGRVNVNTASSAVLSCLPGMTADVAEHLVSYRQQNPDNLLSIAWVVDALNQSNASALQQLAAGDYITTRSYQYSADIAALGPFGRGYRRVKFIFDVSNGTPQIVYRQDLSHLGWALGRYVRQSLTVASN